MDPVHAHIIDAYCKFLNLVGEANDEDWVYERTPFDPDHNKYAYIKEHYRYQVSSYDVIALTIYDGDDGGPTELTVWLDHDDGSLVHGVSIFDTLMGQWLSDRQLINTKGFGTPDPHAL